MLNVAPATEVDDLERLLLDTARLVPGNVRLFVLAATWLHRYGTYCDATRLARLVREELEPDYRPVLGMLLDWADTPGVAEAVAACREGVTGPGRPLSDAASKMAVLREQAEASASELSRRWGRWLSEEAMQFKADALRPLRWILNHNPWLTRRPAKRQ